MNFIAGFIFATLLTLLSIWAFNRWSGMNVATLGARPAQKQCGC